MTWKDAYVESQVLSANPLELIRLLYEHAFDSVQSARHDLKAGDIAGRSKAVCQAIAVLAELESSLDHASGGAVSRNLEQLYHYIRERLTAGNMLQQDAPLAEAESLLSTLLEAWRGVCAQSPAEPQNAEFCTVPVPCAWQCPTVSATEAWSA